MSVLVVTGLLVPGPVAAVAEEEPPPDEGVPQDDVGEASQLSADELAAIDEAVATGERVEVLSARSEWDSLFAEPSGELTLESSVAAVRTRVGAEPGGWRVIDTTLEVTADGVTPVAPVNRPGIDGGSDSPRG